MVCAAALLDEVRGRKTGGGPAKVGPVRLGFPSFWRHRDMDLLELSGLEVAYGTIRAVRNLSLTVGSGELVALLGPNGAGKSSTLNAIVGLAPRSAGTIRFDGVDITNKGTEAIVGMGLTLVPEGRRVFPKLSVRENLGLGGSVRLGRSNQGQAKRMEEMLSLFPILAARLHQAAGTLSGGEQQQLAVARALMSSPRLLLMDEPSLGLGPMVVDTVFEMIQELSRSGVTILLVEQNVRLALEVASRGYVLASGSLHMQGSSDDLIVSGQVEAAYLGVAEG